MNLKQIYLTNNLIFKRNVDKVDYRYTDFQKNGPQGIIVHDTSAGNPELRRYVQPDDGTIGKNQYNNDWNRPEIGEVLVHAFIGKLTNGNVATIQTAPLNFRGLHVGSGSKGSYNNTHIGFEICDDNKFDGNGKLISYGNKDYFSTAYKEAVEFCAYICKQYSLDPLKDGVILGHYEAWERGMGSNHGDPQEWFKNFGKSMVLFRADVNAELKKSITIESPATINLEHWAMPDWNYLNSIGLTVHEQRFDDPITRGEVFSLLARYDKMK